MNLVVYFFADFLEEIMKERFFWFMLSSIKGLGINGVTRIYNKYAALGLSEHEISNLSAEELSNEFNIELDITEKIKNIYCSNELRLLYDKVLNAGINILLPGDKYYPERIKQIYKLPPLLYVKGNISLLNNSCIGISGSRNAGDEGRRYSYTLAGKATDEHLTVVSGFARGIDESAHFGAISNGGSTIIVLPTGMFTHWKKDALFENEDACCTVSMFFPTLKFNKWTAVARNHLIASLSDIMFIIEADKPSGSYMQGKISLKLGRPIFVFDRDFKGNKSLIEKGAAPVNIHTVDKIFNSLEFFFPSINFINSKYEVTEIWETKAV